MFLEFLVFRVRESKVQDLWRAITVVVLIELVLSSHLEEIRNCHWCAVHIVKLECFSRSLDVIVLSSLFILLGFSNPHAVFL